MRLSAFRIDKFSRQVTLAHHRVSKLLERADTSSPQSKALLPEALKELGLIVEELEVALEEVKQQNEQLTQTLETATQFQKQYQDLFEFAPEAYLITDESGAIQDANPAAVHLLGVADQSWVGKSLFLFIDETDRQVLRNRLLQCKQTQEGELYFKTQDQRRLRFQFWMKSTQAAGELRRIQWCLKQIPQQERLIEELGDHCLPKIQDMTLLQRLPQQTFNRGDIISMLPGTVWLVVKGIIKLTTLTNNNEEILLGLAKPNTVFGANLTTLPLYQATALAESCVIAIPKNQLESSAQLMQILTTKIHHRLHQSEALVAIAGQRRVIERLSLLLKFLKEEIGEPVSGGGVRLSVRLTHEDLASACCTTRVTVTRMLGQLQKRKLLTFDRMGHLILLQDL